MAGYDLSFCTNKNFREKAQTFLKFLQSIYTRHDLEFRYRTSIASNTEIEIYVTVDGPLPAMQHLGRILPDILQYYIHFDAKGKRVQTRILMPFMVANNESLRSITEMVFRVAKDFDASPNPFSISNEVMDKTERKGRAIREAQAIRGIITIADQWFAGLLNKKQAIILCDQCIEDLIKTKLSLPKTSRKGFNDVVTDAYNQGVLTKMEKYRLKRFHNTRNRIQHRGSRVDLKTVNSMLRYCLELMERLCG